MFAASQGFDGRFQNPVVSGSAPEQPKYPASASRAARPFVVFIFPLPGQFRARVAFGRDLRSRSAQFGRQRSARGRLPHQQGVVTGLAPIQLRAGRQPKLLNQWLGNGDLIALLHGCQHVQNLTATAIGVESNYRGVSITQLAPTGCGRTMRA